MNKIEDLTGKRFNKLLVIERVENDKSGKSRWRCLCDCGNRVVVGANNLRNGNTHSCGCLKKKMMSAKQFKHGDAGGRKSESTRLYRIWRGMISRCYTPSATEYEYYGGRGISVCDAWRNNYSEFRCWALSNGYNDDLTIDRINNNSDYSPNNCRWISKQDQMLNKSNNRLITFNNVTKTITEWAYGFGIDRRTLSGRIDRYHWPVEKALTTPVRLRGDCS